MSDADETRDARWLEGLASPMWEALLPSGNSTDSHPEELDVRDISREVLGLLGRDIAVVDESSSGESFRVWTDANTLRLDYGRGKARCEVVLTAHFLDSIDDEQVVLSLDESGRGSIGREKLEHLKNAEMWTATAIGPSGHATIHDRDERVIPFSTSEPLPRRSRWTRTAWGLAAAASILLLIRVVAFDQTPPQSATTSNADSSTIQLPNDTTKQVFGLTPTDSASRGVDSATLIESSRDVAFFVPEGTRVSSLLEKARTNASFACGLENAINRDQLLPLEKRQLRHRLAPNDTSINAQSAPSQPAFRTVEELLLFQLGTFCIGSQKKE